MDSSNSKGDNAPFDIFCYQAKHPMPEMGCISFGYVPKKLHGNM